MRKYGRGDIEYATWYSRWHKQLALQYTRDELNKMEKKAAERSKKAASYHLKAIQASTSMMGCSQRRAQTRNSLARESELRLAVEAAIEIYELFPEHTKEANDKQNNLRTSA